MKENKFTFKEHKPQGRYRSFYHSYWDIKLKRKVVGHIYKKKDGGFSISFSVKQEKTEKDPCPFRNITIKASFPTIEETKKWLEEKTTAIMEHHDLHYSE